MKKKGKITGWIYWFSLALAVILVYKFLDSFNEIGKFISNLIGNLMPFLIGILISLILNTPCKNIEKTFKKSKNRFLKKRSRGTAVFSVYLIMVLILFILVNVILPPMVTSITDLINHLPGYYNSIIRAINNLPEDSFLKQINAQDMVAKIAQIDIGKYLSLENITEYVKGVISVASGIFDSFVTIIVSVYILMEKDSIIKFSKKVGQSLFKEEKYDLLVKYISKTNEIFYNFISGQLLDAVIIGVVATMCMMIMRIQYAALLGFLIGLFNLIPFFGAIVAVAIALFITFCTGGVGQAIWLALVIILLQQIDANIINPKILGDKLKISPILVIFSVTFVGAYWGVLGMFLAVPIAAIIKILVNDYLDYRIRKRQFEN